MDEEVRAEVALDAVLEAESAQEVEDEFETTYRKWQEHLGKLAYIYDYIMDKKKVQLNRINVAILSLTAVTTLLLAAQFGVDQCQYSFILITFQVILTLASFTSTVLGGIATVYGLADAITTIQRYLDTVDGFYSAMTTNDGLPKSLRTSFKDFVIGNQDRYNYVIRHAPSVGTNSYIEAMRDFNSAKSKFKDLLQK